jgi:hypothetical protein
MDPPTERIQRQTEWMERCIEKMKDCTYRYFETLACEKEELLPSDEEIDIVYSDDESGQGSGDLDFRDQNTERGSTPLSGSGTSTPKNMAIPLDDEEIMLSDFSSSLFISFAINADLFDPFLQILSFL